jgi:hypothetical protein
MKALAMGSIKGKQEPELRQNATRADRWAKQAPDEETDAFEAPEADENDLDESDLQDADDGRLDVFILDDDGDPLPEYGDFWFPD